MKTKNQTRQPYVPHPNLATDVNTKLAESELQGGVWLKKPTGELVKNEPYLPVGKKLIVQTRNTTYLIEKRGEEEFYISGSAEYCPDPVRARIHGSNFGGRMLKMNWVGRGMYMEFSTDEHEGVIVTSQVQEVTETE